MVVAFAGLLPSKYGLRQNNYKNYIILCGFLIAAVSGLRSPYTGTGDTYQYMLFYKTMQNYDSFQYYYDLRLSDFDFFSSEAGLAFCFWLLGHVFTDGQTATIASSLFITWAACRFIRKNSVDIPISLTIYVCLTMFTFNMNGMRQALAMAVCLFAYEQAKSRNIVSFVALVLLAMLFHRTAMCFFPVWFLPRLKNSLGNWLFYICGLLLCLLFIDKIIVGYYNLLGDDYSDNPIATGGGLFVVLLYLGGIALTLYKHKILEYQAARVAFLGALVGFVAYISRFIGTDILERVSYYYYYFLILLIPEAMQKLDREEHRFIKVFFVIGCVLLFSYRIWNGAFRDFTLFFL